MISWEELFLTTNLYRLSPLSGSTETIDTFWEKADLMFIRKKQSVPLEIKDLYVGEMSPQETKDCLVNEETRNIQQLTVNDKKLADKLFQDLMGADSIPRKKFIEENAEKAKIYV